MIDKVMISVAEMSFDFMANEVCFLFSVSICVSFGTLADDLHSKGI
jgi:hypothetical protein